jgi:hypothetical protein
MDIHVLEEVSSVVVLTVILAVGLLQIAFIVLRYTLSVPN